MELESFKSEEFGSVRTATINGDVMFVGKDVAGILGYTNTPKAVRDHVDEEDKLTERIVLSGQSFKDRLHLHYSRYRQKEEAEMTEREFCISIIPELAELIVYLSYLCPADRNSVEIEMLKSCKKRPQAYRMMRKIWNIIRSQLKE